MRAVQVAGDPNQLLAGTLQTGDHVDLVANIHVTSSNGAASSAEDRIVLSNLLVLNTSGDASKLATSSTTANSVILAIGDTQVQKLFYVLKNADWTLELRPVINATNGAGPTVGQSEVLKGGS
jgi:Flp pilus assembly protein CpaB